MTEQEIKKKFDEVQEILDSMQGAGATCMFIGHEGNHFVISGSPTNISAQIVFAMMRYLLSRISSRRVLSALTNLTKSVAPV